jgi:DNA transposition AAA+ family ATPase
MSKNTHLTGKAAAANDDSAQITLRQIDAEIISLLRAYKERHSISENELGKRLKSNGTYVNRAFNGTFNGDAAAFESATKALLESELNSRSHNTTLMDHGFLVEPMRDFFDTVQHSQSIGVAWCAPGKGKSKGLEVYARKNVRCIVVTAIPSMSGWRALRDAVIDAVPSKRRIANESWDKWIKRTFKGSGILLIVDNAHLISTYARHWLAYEWHDQTGCPVALVGNQEIVRQWSANEQHKSRVGVAYEITPRAKPSDTASNLLKLHLPAGADDAETRQLATQILRSGGACRAVEKHALVAADLMTSGDYTPAEAFRAANALLLSDVKLAA